MEPYVDRLLCCPLCMGGLVHGTTGRPAGTITSGLQCANCGKYFEDNGLWIDFLDDRGLVYRNSRDKFFRSVYSKIYTPATNAMFLLCGGAKSARNEVMERLMVREGDSVLETGIGYGENFLWLKKHISGLRLYGLDIQQEMLAHCSANLVRWNINASIVRADALSLPYKDGVFDVVFHLGAINLFEDKRKAITEMIRVSKPGTHIVIADETEKAGRLFRIFTGDTGKVIPPVDMIPQEMKNISLRTIWKGYGYVIEFDVP